MSPLKRLKRLMECSPFPSKTKETSSFTLNQIELYNAFLKSDYTLEINSAVLKSCRLSSKSVFSVKKSDIRHDGSGAKYGTLVGVGLPPGRVNKEAVGKQYMAYQQTSCSGYQNLGNQKGRDNFDQNL